MLNLVCVVVFVVVLVVVLEDLALSNAHESSAHSECRARAVGYVHQPAVWNLVCVVVVLVVLVMILEDLALCCSRRHELGPSSHCPDIAPLHLLETSLEREEDPRAAPFC